MTIKYSQYPNLPMEIKLNIANIREWTCMIQRVSYSEIEITIAKLGTRKLVKCTWEKLDAGEMLIITCVTSLNFILTRVWCCWDWKIQCESTCMNLNLLKTENSFLFLYFFLLLVTHMSHFNVHCGLLKASIEHIFNGSICWTLLQSWFE